MFFMSENLYILYGLKKLFFILERGSGKSQDLGCSVQTCHLYKHANNLFALYRATWGHENWGKNPSCKPEYDMQSCMFVIALF